MDPIGQPSPETPLPKPTTSEVNLTVYKNKTKFATIALFFTFVALIGITIRVLWYFESRERGVPDIQNEAKQLLNEAKKEIGQ